MICVGNMCKAICGVAARGVWQRRNLHWSTGSGYPISTPSLERSIPSRGVSVLVFAALFAKVRVDRQVVAPVDLYSALTALIFSQSTMHAIDCLQLVEYGAHGNGCVGLFESWSQRPLNHGRATAASIESPSSAPCRLEALLIKASILRAPIPEKKRLLHSHSLWRFFQ
jgi:hypothetical protein